MTDDGLTYAQTGGLIYQSKRFVWGTKKSGIGPVRQK